MEKISLPVRIFAIVIVLVGAAGMLAMRTMGPSDEPVAMPLPVPAKAPAAKAPAAKAPAPKAPAKKPAASPEVPPVNAPKAVKRTLPPTGFPTVVDRALLE